MNSMDYEYIAENISNISRIPVRVYKEVPEQNDRTLGHELLYFFNTSNFPMDPGLPYLTKLLEIRKKVSYYITPIYHFYGVIRHDEFTLIIGPSYQNAPSRSQIRDYMFLLGLREKYHQSYDLLLKSITPMPLEMFLHLLCMIYFYISSEKLNISDVLLYDCSGTIPTQEDAAAGKDLSTQDYADAVTNMSHDTYHFEREMLSLVTNGDVSGLEKLFSSTSPGQAGKTAGNYLRQIKNIFIASVTLVSRAAIEGGMPMEDALSLSDRYIQHCEKYYDPQQILNLQHHMVLDYATLVHELTYGYENSAFLRSVTNYVHEHLTENLSVEQIAKALYLSANHLSTKFRKESGMTLSSYIHQQKIRKAKEYLKNTNRSLSEISTFLGFSSQAYFQNVFKKQTGMTPREFREHPS